MSYSTELRTTLEAGIHELEQDIARLRSALAALDEEPQGEPAAHRRASRRSRRSDARHEVVPVGKLSSLLEQSNGMTTAELSRLTNGGHEQILTLLKELERDGNAHRSGTRRSTRWHAGGSAGRTSQSANADGASGQSATEASPASAG